MVSTDTIATHYEFLEVTRKASGVEIASAYRSAKQAWDPHSLAVYSLYSPRELSTINHQLDEAYRVLSDPFLRARYDAVLAGQEPVSSIPSSALAQQQPPFRQAVSDLRNGGEEPPPIDAALLEEIEQAERFDGPFLARIRTAKGISIEEIADRTKIGRNHLREIEAESFDRPIAPVYLKGYLRQYALAIGLDPAKVVATYPPLNPKG